MSKERADVIFVCLHNAGRSVAAKLLFNDRAKKLGLSLRAESAGTIPREHINPSVQRVLESFKLDCSNEVPKLLSDDMVSHQPRLISMGCNVDSKSCPSIGLAEMDDWQLPDPSEMADDEHIVSLVHDIARRVNGLIRKMSAA